MTRKKNKQASGDGCLFSLIPVIIAVLIMLALMVITNNNLAQPGKLAVFFTPEVKRWEEHILVWAQNYDLDPNLIATVIQIESCGNPQALSPAGARGLFQVMPYHFVDEEDPFLPEVNARRGLTYLQRALESAHGDVRLALAGYNGGIGLIGQPESAWSQETQNYVYWGAQIYADARAGKTHSSRLDEWLANGGAELCRRARQVRIP